MNNLKNAMNTVLPSDSYVRDYVDFDLYNLYLDYYSQEKFKAQLEKKYPNIKYEDNGYGYCNNHPVVSSFQLLNQLLEEIASNLTGYTHTSYLLDDSNIYTFAQYTRNPQEVLETCSLGSFCRHDFYDEVKDIFRERLDGFIHVELKELESFKTLILKLEEIYNTQIDYGLFEVNLKNSSFISNLLKVNTTKYTG
jgi:hypothetical protein